MPKANGLEAEIPYSINGIPCIIGVESYFYQAPYKGSRWSCDSDIDWYGDEEIVWSILDRKGYYAEWLERKLSDGDRESIDEVVRNHFSD